MGFELEVYQIVIKKRQKCFQKWNFYRSFR